MKEDAVGREVETAKGIAAFEALKEDAIGKEGTEVEVVIGIVAEARKQNVIRIEQGREVKAVKGIAAVEFRKENAVRIEGREAEVVKGIAATEGETGTSATATESPGVIVAEAATETQMTVEMTEVEGEIVVRIEILMNGDQIESEIDVIETENETTGKAKIEIETGNGQGVTIDIVTMKAMDERKDAKRKSPLANAPSKTTAIHSGSFPTFVYVW